MNAITRQFINDNLINGEHEPNTPLTIESNEQVEVTIDNKTVKGHCDVVMEFIPRQNIAFNIKFDNFIDNFNSRDSIIKDQIFFCERELNINAFMQNIAPPVTMKMYLSGEPINVLGKKTRSISEIWFYIINFPDFRDKNYPGKNDITLSDNDWEINLYAFAKADAYRKLRNTGGYAITHIGKINRKDGRYFSAKKAINLIEALRWFFSFICGYNNTPFLPVGFGRNKKRVWEYWNSPMVSSWKSVFSWFNIRDSKQIAELFPGFLALWKDEVWKERLLEAIWWYVNANSSSSSGEAKIILIQAALELLSYNYLVNDKFAITEAGFGDLRAADNIRLLFSNLELPLCIPSDLSLLTKLAKKNQLKDSSHVLTKFRNDIIHPKKEGFITNIKCISECWMLGLWYVDLVLLRLFNYNYTYWNRTNYNTEKVPWKKLIDDIKELEREMGYLVQNIESTKNTMDTENIIDVQLEKVKKISVNIEGYKKIKDTVKSFLDTANRARKNIESLDKSSKASSLRADVQRKYEEAVRVFRRVNKV